MGLNTVVISHCLLTICITAVVIGAAQGARCYNVLLSNPHFDCPPDKYCCGEQNEQRCCNVDEHHHSFVSRRYASSYVKRTIAAVVMFITMVVIVCSCCFCCHCCLLYKVRQRSRAITMIPMQTRAPVPSRDSAGFPLYPVQQYYPVNSSQQAGGYYPSQQPPPPPMPHPGRATAPPNYPGQQAETGFYAGKQLVNTPNQNFNQPFTYGMPMPLPAKVDQQEYN